MTQIADTITDEEFGLISIRRFATSKHIRIKIGHDGRLSATIPHRAALRHVHDLLDASRLSLRQALQKLQSTRQSFVEGQAIGASHRLRVSQGNELTVKVLSPDIVITLPPDTPMSHAGVQAAIRPVVIKTLRIEAKAYLPRRLDYLAREHGFYYRSLRFSSASTRWGSCSSHGVISLNIWLMQLDHALIDYVLIHELSHTRHMNHSRAFWDTVARIDPDYTTHRKMLKDQHPYV